MQADIAEFKGKTPIKIEVFKNTGTTDGDNIVFCFSDGSTYKMYHQRDCCEDVWIQDVTGDIQKLVGWPLLSSKEVSYKENDCSGSTTWTFYHLRCQIESVTIRWNGSSNGYYSESVDIEKTAIHNIDNAQDADFEIMQ